MLVLKNRDIIHLNTWSNVFEYARVFAIRGSAVENGKDPIMAEFRAIENGHELAGTIHTGHCITSSKAYYERENAIARTAIVVEDGQTVEIENRKYIVKVVRGNEKFVRNCDPIQFVPV